MAIRTETGREFWRVESDAVKAEVKASVETKKVKELAAFEELREPPKTPGQYHL